MSIQLSSAVWKHSKQKSGALLVLLAIADYANVNGDAWPAVATLARKARMSVRNVQRSISALQRAGELKVHSNQGRRGSNIYKICLPLIEPINGDGPGTSDARVADPVTPMSSSGDAGVTQSVNESSIKPTPIVPKGDEMEFWIKLSFDCFRQTPHPVSPYIRKRLSEHIPFLGKKNAPALIKFYCCAPLDSKDVPFNSRKHSAERLLWDLPRQLALAARACPPSPPKKKEPPRWREFFRWKYPDCYLPISFYDLSQDQWSEYERGYEEFKRQSKLQMEDGSGP